MPTIKFRCTTGLTLKHRDKRRATAVAKIEGYFLNAALTLQRFDRREITQTLAPLAETHPQLPYKLPRQRALTDMHLRRPMRQRLVVARLGLQRFEDRQQTRTARVGQITLVHRRLLQLIDQHLRQSLIGIEFEEFSHRGRRSP